MARERGQRDDEDEAARDDGGDTAEREDAEHGDEERLSTAKKVVAGAAIGAVAVPAAVGAARKLLGSDDSGDGDGAKGSRRRGPSSRAKSASSATKTRDQLYRQATRLKIEGRSRMTKAELERAVERARKR